MHIQKVLNSSVVLVQDDSGEESILLGKGIGYGRKAGEPIERHPQTACSFHCPTRTHSLCWSCFPAFRHPIWN